MLDALLPFVDALERGLAGGAPLATAWTEAAEVATTAAAETAELRPKIGRARPLAERSVGTPDPGATSLAMCTRVVGQLFATTGGELVSEGIRVVVGSDDAGLDYKELLKADLKGDERVAEVIDVGVGSDEQTAYPHMGWPRPTWSPRARPIGRC